MKNFYLVLLLVVFSFITTMSEAQIYYSENWNTDNDGDGDLVSGWTPVDRDGYYYAFVRINTQACEGYSARAILDTRFRQEKELISPLLGTGNGNPLTVKFKYKLLKGSEAMTSDFGSVTLEYAASSAGPWTVAETISSNHVPSTNCAEKQATFTPPSGNLYIKFKIKNQINALYDYALYLDDVEIIQQGACIPPHNIAVTGVGENAATLTWQAPPVVPGIGYEYHISTTAAEPSAAGIQVTATTASVTNLSNGTDYYVWVRSVCAANAKSLWRGPVHFATSCALKTEFSENFDNVVTLGALPVCWGSIGATGQVFTTTEKHISSPNSLFINAGQDNTDIGLVSLPQVSNAAAGTHRLKFKIIAMSLAGGAVQVGYLTIPGNPATFVQIGNNYKTTSTKQYDAIEINPIQVPAGITTLAIRHAGGSIPAAVLVDDVIYEQVPACLEVSNVNTANVTFTTATLNWTASPDNPSGGYQYFLNTSATTPLPGAVPSGSVAAGITTAVLSNLVQNTTYYAWVRSNCGISGTGAWVGPVSFYTGYCTPYSKNSSFDFLNNFSTTGANVNISNLGSGFSSGGYKDYYNMHRLETPPGQPFEFTVVTTGSPGLTIWADLDKNGAFEINELLYRAPNYFNTSLTDNITLPLGTPPGEYRMRVFVDFNSNWGNQACEFLNFYGNVSGEAEDYKLVVTPPEVACNTRIYVNKNNPTPGNGSSWATAIHELADALKIAKTCSLVAEIWVAKGTYKPLYSPTTTDFGIPDANPKNNAFLLVKNVKVYGGFAGNETDTAGRNLITNETILNGHISGSDSCYHVVISSAAVGAAALNGFTITGGSAKSEGNIQVNGYHVDQNRGGGMSIVTSSPHISNCIFSGNTASLRGGGVYSDFSAQTFTNCSFIRNAALIGGGLSNDWSELSKISNCIFSENQAGIRGGGINFSNSSPTIVNCIFSANKSANGGGIYIRESSPTISNATFSNNTATTSGGGIHNELPDGSLTISNSIIFGNAPEGIFNGGSGGTSPVITYSLVQEVSTGTGNLNGTVPYPVLFTNAANPVGSDGLWRTADDGLKLAPGSPAIDAGNNTSVPTGIVKDVTGMARIQNTTVDMGAYETAPCSVSIATHPQGGSFCPGGSRQLTVSALGNGLHYQWKKDGSNVGSDAATYTATEAGNYTVVVTGECEVTSTPAVITINTATVINTQPQGGSYCATAVVDDLHKIAAIASVGGVLLEVGAAGTNLQYQWKMNDSNIPGANSPAWYATQPGSYTVIVTGACGEVTSVPVIVTAIYPPQVNTHPAGGSICQGGNLLLAVLATGENLSYQWMFRGPGSEGFSSVAGANSAHFNATQAGQYRVEVSNNCGEPAVSNTAVIEITGSVVPAVSITANPGSTICAGTNVTFTATPQNGGETPSYQWKLNGTNVGANSATYSNNNLVNGDVVTVVLTSSSGCASPVTATGSITVTVNNLLAPSVNISANPGNTICSGSSVTFTATAVNGGGAPAYQWKKNGANAGSNSNTYIDNTLVTGDVITVVLTSSAGCASPATATSNAVTMQVTHYVTPSVNITASPAGTICAGTTVTYSATPQNGGATPAYQWKLNGNNVGSNSATYSNSSLAHGDVISVVLTSSASCTTTGTATSNSITTTLGNAILPVVMVSDIVNDNCSGKKRITVNVTGGTAPYSYWLSGGMPQSSNSFDVVPGSYTVHVADATTCSGTVNTTVTGPEKLEVTVSSTSASCATNTKGTISLTTTGGVQPYSYRLTGSAPQSSNVFTGLNKGSYLITVSDAGGCSITVPATVSSDNNVNAVSLQTTTSPVLCATGSGSVQLTALFAGGTGELSTSYEWYKDGSSSVYATTQNLTAVPAGTYQALIKVYDAGNPGCVNYYNAWAVVTQNNVSSATISGTATVMQGAAAPEVKFTAIGGTAPYTYVYRVNNGAEQTVTGTTGSVTQSTSQAGVFTYSLIRVTDGGGCVLNVNGTAVVTVKADSTSASPPDLSIQLMVLPAIAHGPTNITGIVKVFEINGVSTTAPITVYISKEDRAVMSFNASATEVSGIMVNNSIWTFDGNAHPAFYKFSTGTVIPGNGEKSFGVSWLFTPGASAGKTNITAMILSGSGGETRIANNVDAETIDYFIN